MTTIFANALNYVQEREEPVDFLDMFYDYEKEKDNLGILEDIQQLKAQKKHTLNPLKQKNQNISYTNNSTMNISTAQDSFGNRSNIHYNSQQNLRHQNGTHSNKQQFSSKLTPLKFDVTSPNKLGNHSNRYQQGSQTQKNLKPFLGATNAVRGFESTSNGQNAHQQAEIARPSGIQNKQRIINGETGDLDDMYKSQLFQNNLSRSRLQQIEFYPSPTQKQQKGGNNFFGQNSVQSKNESQINDISKQDAALQFDIFDQNNNPYSLRNANNILKEHFNLTISNVPDTRKKWVVRKVHKVSNNPFMSTKNEDRGAKHPQHQGQFADQQNEHTDANETDVFQQNIQNPKEQLLLSSLKPNAGGFNFPTTAGNGGYNSLINLNNLMVSLNSPSFYFSQQQFYNQGIVPKTAPSDFNESNNRDKGFQIKKLQNNNGSYQKPATSHSQMKKHNRQIYLQDQIPQNNFFSRTKLTKGKSDQSLQFGRLKPSQNFEEYNQNHFQNGGALHKKGKDNHSISTYKGDNQYYPTTSGMSSNMSIHIQPGDPQKTLPLYCLNFNQNLEKRLLLNSLGV